MYENYLTAALVIYAIDRIMNWYHLHALRSLADEAMFPANDPIMTSSIEAFEYEEEEAVPPNWEYDTPEEESAPVAAPAIHRWDTGEGFDYLAWDIDTDGLLDEHLPQETAGVPLEGADSGFHLRCQALTKSGAQCKNKPNHPHARYCRTHED